MKLLKNLRKNKEKQILIKKISNNELLKNLRKKEEILKKLKKGKEFQGL